ncbi:hypothetical protein HDV05_006328 [Chytridiales sp. JEL 0842]|nr:hypothetical protein HDV05_006328 [Chytridiales sp. JEL 0842]
MAADKTSSPFDVSQERIDKEGWTIIEEMIDHFESFAKTCTIADVTKIHEQAAAITTVSDQVCSSGSPKEIFAFSCDKAVDVSLSLEHAVENLGQSSMERGELMIILTSLLSLKLQVKLIRDSLLRISTAKPSVFLETAWDAAKPGLRALLLLCNHLEDLPWIQDAALLCSNAYLALLGSFLNLTHRPSISQTQRIENIKFDVMLAAKLKSLSVKYARLDKGANILFKEAVEKFVDDLHISCRRGITLSDVILTDSCENETWLILPSLDIPLVMSPKFASNFVMRCFGPQLRSSESDRKDFMIFSSQLFEMIDGKVELPTRALHAIPTFEFFQSLLTFMANCPMDDERSEAHKCFVVLFGKLANFSKIKILQSMLFESQFANIPPLALSILKDQIHSAAANDTEKAVFQSEIVREVFIKPIISPSYSMNRQILNPDIASSTAALLEHSTFLNQLLNFAMYLTIREKPYEQSKVVTRQLISEGFTAYIKMLLNRILVVENFRRSLKQQVDTSRKDLNEQFKMEDLMLDILKSRISHLENTIRENNEIN